MPPYIEEIAYKLYALMSELIKKCVIPFCCVAGVIIVALIIYSFIKRINNH